MSKNPIKKIHFCGIAVMLIISTIDILGIILEDILKSNEWIIYIMLIIFCYLLIISIIKTSRNKKIIFVAYDIIILDIIYLFIRLLIYTRFVVDNLAILFCGTYLFVCINMIDESSIPPKSKWYKTVVNYIFFPLCILGTILVCF